jgi:hypothetical protein
VTYILTRNGKTYEYSDLMQIGHELASVWGGSCYDVSVTSDEVVFDCIEHGELFIATLDFDELEEYA